MADDGNKFYVHRFAIWAIALLPVAIIATNFADLFGRDNIWRIVLKWGGGILFATCVCLHIFATYETRQINQRIASGKCLSCGYDIRASKDRCPECGCEIKQKP
jgi:hypothetical protein